MSIFIPFATEILRSMHNYDVNGFHLEVVAFASIMCAVNVTSTFSNGWKSVKFSYSSLVLQNVDLLKTNSKAHSFRKSGSGEVFYHSTFIGYPRKSSTLEHTVPEIQRKTRSTTFRLLALFPRDWCKWRKHLPYSNLINFSSWPMTNAYQKLCNSSPFESF